MRFLGCTDEISPTRASASTCTQNQRGDLIRMGPVGPSGAESDGELMTTNPRVKPQRPSFYRVVLLNDDFTPMDFVVNVLEQIFRKAHEDAINIMLVVHNKGAATCGVYTRDVAETKVDQVIEYARINEYPLQCVMEKE